MKVAKGQKNLSVCVSANLSQSRLLAPSRYRQFELEELGIYHVLLCVCYHHYPVAAHCVSGFGLL